MRPMRPMGLMGHMAVLQPHADHPLSQAAFLDKVLLQSFNLPVQQVVSLANEADRNL